MRAAVAVVVLSMATIALSKLVLREEGRQLEQVLETMWTGKTVEQAYKRLMMADIVVTNEKDKFVQLKKLRQLQFAAQQRSAY